MDLIKVNIRGNWSVQDLGGSPYLNYSIGYLSAGARGAGTNCAWGCGSGLGRANGNILVLVVSGVELVGMMGQFLLEAQSCLQVEGDMAEPYHGGNLQGFTPPLGSRDATGSQWVSG